MSAEASIPTPLLPGKDPPLRLSSTSPSPAPPISTSSSRSPPAEMASPQPQTQTTTTSAGPLPLAHQTVIPIVARPNFMPFFTLINDPATQSTHHPRRIHYIFSDDDESEALTAACVRSLQADAGEDSGASREIGGSEQGIRESKSKSETSSSSSATFRKGEDKMRGKGEGRREERVIIVDVNESGDGVLGANSLSASWQVVSAEVASAPTFNDESAEAGAEEGERGLMLKIEGVGIGDCEEMAESAERRKGKSIGESSIMGEEEMQTLMEGFDRKMGLLRKIVASGESWEGARKEKAGGDGESGKDV